MARPRLKAHVTVVPVPGEGAYLLAGDLQAQLRGEVYGDLAPLLDGRRTLEEIFSLLEGRWSVHEVYRALTTLRRGEWLGDGPLLESPRISAFWEEVGVDPDAARERLRATRVVVEALGDLEAVPWEEALAELGIGAEPTAKTELTVVVTDDYLEPSLAAIDARQRARSQPWVLVRPVGRALWLGPLFEPGRTGCWSCLAHRLAGHRRLEAHLTRATGRPGPFARVRAALPSTEAAARALLATEVAQWLVTRIGTLVDRVLTLDAHTLERQGHRLVLRPQCPACGEPPSVDRVEPVLLEDDQQSTTVPNDAGRRACSAEDTVERLRHHVSPITGIIGHLNPREADAITPLYITDHSFVDMDTELYFLQEGFRKRSGGKGTTEAQAMASALGESIERYSGVFQGDEPRRRATMAQLGEAAVHPNAVMGYSERQYREREQHGASGSRVRWVPEPFDPSAEVEWTPLWNLTAERTRWLPTACCYYGYWGGERAGAPRFAMADSNGCAAGNTRAEAVLQGLLELVERDAVALWWYNRVRRPGVDLDASTEPYLPRLVEHYASRGRALWALELTSDLGIPTFAAVSRRLDGPPQDVILGFGTHLDPRIALLRACTELNQSLPSVPGPVVRPGPRYPGHNHDAIQWWSNATVESEPYLLPDAEAPAAEVSVSSAGSASADVMRCVRTLSERGLETLVLDQTRPDAGLHVVRVVVPGLRHFWARFGPGRLYDIPVRQGWRDVPLPEHRLNEYVVYF